MWFHQEEDRQQQYVLEKWWPSLGLQATRVSSEISTLKATYCVTDSFVEARNCDFQVAVLSLTYNFNTHLYDIL